MEFDWNVAKHEKTRRERGFGFDYAARIFAGPVGEAIDLRRDYGEQRIRAIGDIDGRVFAVVYTDRSRIRWIIIASKASGKDRRQ